MNMKIIAAVIGIVGLVMIGSHLYAQEQELEYSFGVVKSFSGNALQVSEYNFDTAQEEEINYVVKNDTVFNDGEQITQIPAGSAVEIEYYKEGAARVAKTVYITDEGDAGEGEMMNEVGDENDETLPEAPEASSAPEKAE